MIKSRILFFIALTVFILVTVILLDYYDEKFCYHDILVEFHGLVFDLIVFGVLITIYETFKSKQDKIERYLEELDDYRFWFSEESKYRTKGLISRILKLGIYEIDLSYCHIYALNPPNKMKGWKFIGAEIEKCFFISTDLQESEFYLATFKETKFYDAHLENSRFGQTILGSTTFSKCNLKNIDFSDAYVLDQSWIDRISLSDNKNCNDLKEKYKISANTVSIDSIDYYQVIDKSVTRNTALTPNEPFELHKDIGITKALSLLNNR